MHYGNALDRLTQLRSNTQELVNDFSRRDRAAPAQARKKILMAFELRWKLEELVLMPALEDTQGMILCGTRDAQRELEALRGLAALAREDGLSADRQRMLLSAINTLASLRTQRVSLALTRAERAAVVELHALGLAMDHFLERWHGEVRRGADDDLGTATSAAAGANPQAIA